MKVVVLARNYKPDRPHAIFVEFKRLLASSRTGLTIDDFRSDK
jgi:hypothetical protein